MRTNAKRFLSLLVLLGIFLTTFPQTTIHAASYSDNIPIITYSLNGSVATYDGIEGKRCGTVYTNDPCTILEIYSSGWVRLRYPKDTGGEKKAYARTEDFFSEMPSNVPYTKLEKNITVYRRADLKEKLGTCYATDEIIILSTNGTSTQIIYPIANGNGFKMGWIEGTHYAYEGLTEVNIPSGYYQIKASSDPNMVIDINGAYTDDCAVAQLFTNHCTTNQGFLILHYRDSYYIIIALHSNKALNVYQGSKQSGARIIQYGPTFTDNELWKIYKTNDGTYCFQSKDSGLFLDIYGNYMSDCNTIQLYEFNNTAAQKFYLESVTVNGKSYDASKHKIEIPEEASNTASQAVSTRLNNLINTYKGTQWNNYYFGTQCKGFANLIFKELFNVYIGPYEETTKAYIKSPNGATQIGYLSTSAMTFDTCKELLMKAQPGDYIQVRRRGKTYGHSMIVVNTSSSGITVFDCNSDGRNTVKVYDINWQDFYSKNSAMSLYHAKDYK